MTAMTVSLVSVLFSTMFLSGVMVDLVASEKVACDFLGFVKCIPPINIGRMMDNEFNFQSLEKDLLLPTWRCVDILLHSQCLRTYDSSEMRLFIKYWDKIATMTTMELQEEALKMTECHPKLGAHLTFCAQKSRYEANSCMMFETYSVCLADALKENCGPNVTFTFIHTVMADIKEYLQCPSKEPVDPLHMEL